MTLEYSRTISKDNSLVTQTIKLDFAPKARPASGTDGGDSFQIERYIEILKKALEKDI